VTAGFDCGLDCTPVLPVTTAPLRRQPWHYINERQKAKECNTCIAPQAAYRSCSGAVPVTDRAGVQSIGRKLSLHPQTDLQPTSHTQPWSAVLMVYIPRNPCNYMNYYSFTDPGVMEGWVGLVGWPYQTPYPWSGHISTINRHRSGKVHQPKIDVVITEPRYQPYLHLYIYIIKDYLHAAYWYVLSDSGSVRRRVSSRWSVVITSVAALTMNGSVRNSISCRWQRLTGRARDFTSASHLSSLSSTPMTIRRFFRRTSTEFPSGKTELLSIRRWSLWSVPAVFFTCVAI